MMTFFKVGVALTNYHVKDHSLHDEDEQCFARMRNRISHTTQQNEDRCRNILRRYRDRRRARVNHKFRRNQFTPVSDLGDQ